MLKASSADKDYVLVEHGFEYTAKDGTLVSIKPNERYILLKKTNEHWWQVCQDYKSKPFYIPAKYVKVLSPFSQNCTGMARTGSAETMDVPSTEYSYKYVPARTGANVDLHRSSIAVGAGAHSLCDVSITREDPDERKFLPDKKDTGLTLGPLRTFQNSKKILDPLKRISYMCPPDFQPSIRPSQSLNDLQVIKSGPPVPSPRRVDVQGEMEQLSIQESHMAGARADSPPEKVIKSEPPAPNPWQPDLQGKMDQLSIQQSLMAGAKRDSSPEKVITCEPPAPNPRQPDVQGKMEQPSIHESHMAGAKRDFSPEKVVKSEPPVPNPQQQDIQGKLGQLFIQESHKAGAKGESANKVMKSESHVPNPYQPDIQSKMEPPSIKESHLAGAKGDLPLEKNYSGVSQASLEKTKDVPSTEYSCNIQPAKAGANANPQRFSIILCAETHSLSDVSVLKGDPAERKPLLDKGDIGHTLGPLRTFHNSKKILDPLKRISYMLPPEFQPSIKPSQSLNDLREINFEPLVRSPCQTDVRSKMEPPSIQVTHVAEAKGDSPPKKDYSGMSQASSEKTEDVPSTEYSYNILSAKASANADLQHFNISPSADTHSHSHISVVKEDPAKQNPLLDKGDIGHTPGPLRTFHNSKKILDPLKRISYMCLPEFQHSIMHSQSLNDLREIKSDPLVPNPNQLDIVKMEPPSFQKSHVAGAKGDSPPEKNYSGMSQASSEKMMDVPSTEYKYNTLPTKTNANVQRFGIAQVADTHSLSEISVIREDLAKQKPLLDKRDPLKRISCVFPPEFQPSVKLSKSLNDLQEIKPERPVPNPCWHNVQSEKVPPSNQEGHVAGAKESSSIEKVVNEDEESFYVNLEEFRKDKEKPRSSSQKLSSSSTLDDWETHTDQGSGQLFYYNSVTGETTWDCPFDQAEEQLISPASLSSAEEDSNWDKHFDESSGQFYFHNPVTGETSWDPPAQDDLHPSGGKPMFSPYDSMERRPPTPEADYPDYPQEDLNYPETDYGIPYIPPPPYSAPSEEQRSDWTYHFKDGQKFYTNNYNGDTLGSPEFQRGHRDANQNSVPITGWRNNHPIYAPQKETEMTQMKGLVKAGLLQKAKTAENGKRLRKNWSTSWTVLEGRILTFFKDAKNLSSNSLKQSSLMTSPEHTVKLQGASLSWASKEKSSKKHVMELKTQDGSEYLIHHESDMLVGDWFTAINKCIGKDARMSTENTSENETESLQEFGSTEKLGMKDEKKGQNTDSDRNVRTKLRKFLLRRPTLQSLREKGYIRDQVFGCDLHHLCEREKKPVPQFVSKSIQAVERRGLDIDGLYRVSGNLAVIQKLRHKVDQDENLNLEDGKWEDVHVITGALKLFFRELPEPLFPYSHFTDFVEAIKLNDQSQKLRRMKELVLSLPQPNLETMRLLFRHLCSVIEHRESNRMSVQSVAIVFGPTLLKPEEEGGNIAMYMVFQNQIVEHVLNQYKNIFS